MALDLSNTGPRRAGITKKNGFVGPHAHRFPVEDVDIDAPPQDSSEEENVAAGTFEADGYGQASDPSDSETDGKLRSSHRGPSLASTTAPARTFSKSKGSQGQASRKYQPQIHARKRKAGDVSDSDPTENISFQQARTGNKRGAMNYSKNGSNTQDKHASRRSEGNGGTDSTKKQVPPGSKEGVSAFIRPPTEGILAELESRTRTESSNQSSPSPKSTLPKPSPKKPEKDQFRQPDLSQLDQPTFKVARLSSQEPETSSKKTRSERAPRKSRGGKSSSRVLKPHSSTSSKLNAKSSNDSVAIAARKLGLEGSTVKMPSSLPSLSPLSDKSYASNDLSSPPTSLNDDSFSTKIEANSVHNDFPDSSAMEEPSSEVNFMTKCPMCKATVDSLSLEGFAGNRRLTIREQAKFCQDHRHRTAKEEWDKRGYPPKINWEDLRLEVKMHSEAIDAIFKGERFSYYRNAYDDFLKREKHKTLRQSLIQGSGIEDFSPGYYGGRGARIMIDNLMANFASKLRRRSSTDQLISARGVTNYVRAVLVPELATLLVMDDMKIDAEEARKVLRESIELGNILSEEQDEEIQDPKLEDM